MAKKKFARKCNACGAGMNEGYCIEGGIEYYCSKECLNTEISDEEFAELYADGEGDSYWTDWSEDPDEYLDDEDEDEVSAALIAAAPELLECLLDVLDADGDLYAMDFNRYRAAIAKATGKVTEDKT